MSSFFARGGFSSNTFRIFCQFAKRKHVFWNQALNFARRHMGAPRWKYNLALASFSVTAFSFEQFGVTDEEMGIRDPSSAPSHHTADKWELLYENANIKAYRRRMDRSGKIYEYRCVGSYKDISPESFIEAQMDVGYRQLWDENVIQLEILEEDEDTNSQLVKWVVRFPYPMYPRLYIYVSRRICDSDEHKVTIVNKAVGNDKYPFDEKYVRIVRYQSKMVVRAHSSLSEKGLDYVLTYYEDNQSAIPSAAYNYVINRVGPHFLQRVHAAAKVLESHAKTKHSARTSDIHSTESMESTAGDDKNGESRNVHNEHAQGIERSTSTIDGANNHPLP